MAHRDVTIDPGSAQGTTRWSGRAMFAIFVVGFALQLIYTSYAEEPYPAITVPAFAWAGPDRARRTEIVTPEIVLYFADSKIERLTEAELFDGVPAGHARLIAGNVFSPRPPEPAARRASLEEWLERRARAIHPSSAPTKCVVNWYEISAVFNPSSDHLELEGRIQELIGEFGVRLDAAARSP